jgi:1-pyrroline-4-hydroxy-2-carboxylate deaminase
VSRPARPSLWEGVLPALTTPFAADGSVDRPAGIAHARWMAERGIRGVIVGGSLGEGATLSVDERTQMVTDLVGALPNSLPVVAAVAAPRTSDAVEQARRAAAAGVSGVLVLPPYVYRGDRTETRAHFSSVLGATDLPCMLYNNPVAYGTDVPPELVLELAVEHSNLTGVKESSGDVRRITALRALLGERIEVAVGLDEAVLEGMKAGAVGWVAGLANALPAESVELFSLAQHGEDAAALSLYRWFLPLLRMDTVPKFVQLIKLLESEVGVGSPRVRLPRLELSGSEREEALTMIRECLARRPVLRRTDAARR